MSFDTSTEQMIEKLLETYIQSTFAILVLYYILLYSTLLNLLSRKLCKGAAVL